MTSLLVSKIFDRFIKGLGDCINKYFSLSNIKIEKNTFLDYKVNSYLEQIKKELLIMQATDFISNNWLKYLILNLKNTKIYSFS